MSRNARGPLSVVALVGIGILAAAAASRLRLADSLRGDPSLLVPSSGLRVSVGGADLVARLSDLRDLPMYRGLLGSDGARVRARWLGWKSTVPDPLGEIPRSGPSALGLYDAGWALVRPARAPGDPGFPRRREGAFTIVASSSAILEAGGERRPEPIALPNDGIVLRVDSADRLASSSRGRPSWIRHLPHSAVATVRVSGGRLREIWTFDCGGDCLLDLLDPAPQRRSDAEAWTAIPPTAVAVEWLRLSPEGLRSWASGLEAEESDSLLARLRRVERFLGVSLLAEIGEALAGPCVVATLPRGPSGTEPLVVLDLRSPDRARAVLDRVVAIGLLGGSLVEEPYRGVPIASWPRGRERGGIEPSAAVDGNVLVVALRRDAVADAIDRRRSATGIEPGGPLRREIAALGPGSWKAASRSARLVESWEAALGLPAGPVKATVDSRGVLSREGRRWVLRGEGTAPAWFADPVFPAVRRLARSLRLVDPSGGATR